MCVGSGGPSVEECVSQKCVGECTGKEDRRGALGCAQEKRKTEVLMWRVKKLKSSNAGNRTRGSNVKGLNVTDYTTLDFR